jgi:hypothetical protein
METPMNARAFVTATALLAAVVTAGDSRAAECIFGEAAPPGAALGTGACCPMPSTEQILAQGRWQKCLESAVDALFDQPEVVQTVVVASYASCDDFEREYHHIAAGGLYGGCWCAEFWADTAKRDFTPKLIARVMMDRAALARSRKVTPQKNAPRPAIDYHGM